MPVPDPVPAAALAPAAVLPGVVAVAEAPAPTWPCSGCDQRVPLEETTCPHCGTAFMGGVNSSVSLHVPGVGDLGAMSPGARFGVMAGGAAILTVVLFLVALVLGHLV